LENGNDLGFFVFRSIIKWQRSIDMAIKVNGKTIDEANGISVEKLLETLKVESPQYVTVQLNGEFLEQENFLSTEITDGDEVEFLYFMGGGDLAFNNEQLERYSRHIILKGVGAKGQKKIRNAKILVIGTGGLGSPAAMYLAAAGVGTIGLADFDVVELSNLQRQIIHSTADVGKTKVQSGRETIAALNPDVQVVTYKERVTAANIADIIHDQDYDFIIDGVDNFPAKFLINDACVLLQKPFSHAGIIGFSGQTLTYVPGQGPCYRCLFDAPPPPGVAPTCREAGVLGVMGGVLGTLQATEALKYILGLGELLTGAILMFDATTMEFRKVRLSRNPKCRLCGKEPTILELFDEELPSCEVR
jgi:thiamine biosynthesis protein ThiS